MRRIANKEHNIFLVSGVAMHQPTKPAPSSLLQPLDDATQEQMTARYHEVERLLHRLIGKPFFAESGFILYNGSCTDFLDVLRGHKLAFDLTITSPPYNIGKEYEKPMSVEEYIEWCSKWTRQIYEVSNGDSAFWLNVGYFEVPEKGLCVPISYLLWDKIPFYMVQEIVWTYGAGVTAKQRLSPRNEKWLFYVKNPDHYTFNLDDIRDPNVKYPNQKKNGKFRCNPLGKNPSDVWEFPKVTTGQDRSSKERTGHPAQFPLSVIERIVKVSSNVAEVVLDPFAGSCSTGIASVGLGRVFVGFEIRRDYCQMAVYRFLKYKSEHQTAQLQSTLF